MSTRGANLSRNSPVCKLVVRLPCCHDTRKEAHAQREAIEEHVDRYNPKSSIIDSTIAAKVLTIRDETQTVRQDTIYHLNDHVREVEAEEEVDLSRIPRREDRFDNGSEMAVEVGEAGDDGNFGGAGSRKVGGGGG